MDKFIITEEMIKNATDYIPLAAKQAIAKSIAENSIQPIEMSVLKAEADSTLALPQIYEENWLLKKMYLAQSFLTEYLHIELPVTFGVKEYDEYFASHPFNQLERMKSKVATPDENTRNKIFDILADYDELKKLVNTEIANEKAARNDVAERVLAAVTVGTTPEFIEKLSNELKEEVDKIPALQEKLKEKRDNAVKAQEKTAKVKETLSTMQTKEDN